MNDDEFLSRLENVTDAAGLERLICQKAAGRISSDIAKFFTKSLTRINRTESQANQDRLVVDLLRIKTDWLRSLRA